VRNCTFRIINDFNQTRDIIIDFVNPFVSRNRHLFSQWHYLFEVDQCREKQIEIRLRFKSSTTNLREIKHNLINELDSYVNLGNLLMKDSEPLGSHEGCHGTRGGTFQGEASDNFGGDWSTIVEILQIGSESAMQILELGRSLSTPRSLEWGGRSNVVHPYYLHLPANQLFIEP